LPIDAFDAIVRFGLPEGGKIFPEEENDRPGRTTVWAVSSLELRKFKKRFPTFAENRIRLKRPWHADPFKVKERMAVQDFKHFLRYVAENKLDTASTEIDDVWKYVLKRDRNKLRGFEITNIENTYKMPENAFRRFQNFKILKYDRRMVHVRMAAKAERRLVRKEARKAYTKAHKKTPEQIEEEKKEMKEKRAQRRSVKREKKLRRGESVSRYEKIPADMKRVGNKYMGYRLKLRKSGTSKAKGKAPVKGSKLAKKEARIAKLGAKKAAKKAP